MSPAFDVAFDAMGGDFAPERPVEAAVQAVRSHGLRIALVGDPGQLHQRLAALGADGLADLVVVPAEDAIGMDEKPSLAVRRKPKASLNVAAKLVEAGEARAIVSAGNSGAVMAAGLFHIGRIEGVQRPALAACWPTLKAPMVFLDLGANIDPTAVQLAQFALFGEVYARCVLHRSRPRVGLLANGSEEGKGSDLTRATHEILTRAEINYAGYCEGREIWKGDLDVVVTDGFTGNVLLKTLEGFVEAITLSLKSEITRSLVSRAGALLMRGALLAVKQKLDYERVGAAPLLGLEKPVLVAHGGASVNALVHALLAARDRAAQDLEAATLASIERHAGLGLFAPPPDLP